jgi:TPR repeat protein
MRWFPLTFVLVAVVGCADPASKKTVTVCTANSCVEQDKSVTTYDPATAMGDPSPEEQAKVAALENLAKDNPSAAYDLGLRFYRGDGVPQNSYKALEWMRTAAEGGDVPAQAALGRFYFTGLEEMGSDLREADKWVSLAAAGGDAESKELLPQVQAALKNDRAYYDLVEKYRYTTQAYWSRGWGYRWYWNPYRRYYYCRYRCY